MKCVRCGDSKAEADFYAHDRTCKPCRRALVRANRVAKVDYYRAKDCERSREPHRKALAIMVGAAWRQQNPEARRAQVAVGNAVRDGRLTRWPCEVCGKKAHAHHPDYSRPMMVTWLCPPHHKAAHLLTVGAANLLRIAPAELAG